MNTTVTKAPMTVEERQVFTALLHLGNFVPQDKQEPFLVALEEASRFVAKGAIRQLPQPAVPPGKAKVQPHMNFLGVLSKKEDLPLARHWRRISPGSVSAGEHHHHLLVASSRQHRRGHRRAA